MPAPRSSAVTTPHQDGAPTPRPAAAPASQPADISRPRSNGAPAQRPTPRPDGYVGAAPRRGVRVALGGRRSSFGRDAAASLERGVAGRARTARLRRARTGAGPRSVEMPLPRSNGASGPRQRWRACVAAGQPRSPLGGDAAAALPMERPRLAAMARLRHARTAPVLARWRCPAALQWSGRAAPRWRACGTPDSAGPRSVEAPLPRSNGASAPRRDGAPAARPDSAGPRSVEAPLPRSNGAPGPRRDGAPASRPDNAGPRSVETPLPRSNGAPGPRRDGSRRLPAGDTALRRRRAGAGPAPRPRSNGAPAPRQAGPAAPRSNGAPAPRPGRRTCAPPGGARAPTRRRAWPPHRHRARAPPAPTRPRGAARARRGRPRRRRRAPRQAAAGSAAAGQVAELATVLAEVLKVRTVAPDSHFFDDLGADSMSMARFCARLRKRPDLPAVSIKDVYRHPTISALVTALAPAKAAARPAANGRGRGHGGRAGRRPQDRHVPVDSHFFDDLGADSMVMARFCARLRKRPDLPTVSIKDVYRHPTITALAAAFGGAAAPAARTDGPTATAEPRAAGPGRPRGCPAAGRSSSSAGCCSSCVPRLPAADDVRRRPRVRVGLRQRDPAGHLPAVAGVQRRRLRRHCACCRSWLKWVLIGRWKPQQIRVWSLAYFRFWLVKTLIQVNPLVLFAGSAALLALPAGARARRSAAASSIFSRPSRCAPTCSPSATGTVIRKDSFFTCYRAHDGVIQTGPVTLGRDVVRRRDDGARHRHLDGRRGPARPLLRRCTPGRRCRPASAGTAPRREPTEVDYRTVAQRPAAAPAPVRCCRCCSCSSCSR